MFINKIKQNFAGFAAVVVAFSALSAMAPANAVGTTTTAGQVGYTYAQRGTSTTSANTVTVNSTVAANQSMSSGYISVTLANVGNPITLQTGDSLRITATYANLTTNAVVSGLSNGLANVYGQSAAVSGYTMVQGSNGTVVRDMVLTGQGGFTAGSVTAMDASTNINWSATGQSTGDQVRMTFTFELVRGGVATALPVRNTNNAGFSVNSTSSDSSMVMSSDMNSVSFQVDGACVWRGENGVVPGSIIDITVGQSGNAGTLATSMANSTAQGGMNSTSASVTNNSFSITMPAGNAYDTLRFSVRAYISSPTNGATFTPTLTAVLRGTSTNVLDTCNRVNVSQTAPTAVANGNGGITLSWTAPANPSAYTSTWDNVSVFLCSAAVNNCGTVSAYGYYSPSVAPVRGYDFRYSGMLNASATTATLNAQSVMPFSMQMGQQMAQWSATSEYRYFLMFSSMNGAYSVTTPITSAIAATVQQQQQQQQQVQQQNTPPTPPTNVPLVAPIAMPATGFTPGGALTLSGSNLANLTSVKIGDAVAKTVASATGVTISVPSDLTPGAHNLLITTSTGSTLFVGAIKVADPAVEAAKAAQAKAAASIAYRAPVDFTVSKSAVAQAAAAKAFAAQYRNAKTAVCVAIPASKATSAAALAAAAKVCDGFKASVPGIKTSVVLGSPSGDKINRVSAEIQG